MAQYIVLVEWDGHKPPTKFYHRVSHMALRVRGDKSQSSTSRRASGSAGEEKAIIFQEGGFLCGSETLARAVASLADEYIKQMPDCKGSVIYGRIDSLETSFVASEQDIAILDHINATLGRKGKPPKMEKMAYRIFCFECLHSRVEVVGEVLNCPNCNGFKVRYEPGVELKLRTDKNKPNVENWFRTRFASGHFEIPSSVIDQSMTGEGYTDIDYGKDVIISDEDDIVMATKIANDFDLIGKMNAASWSDAAYVLDRLFVAVLYNSDRVDKARISAIVDILSSSKSADATLFPIVPVTEFDIMSAAFMGDGQKLASIVVKTAGATPSAVAVNIVPPSS